MSWAEIRAQARRDVHATFELPATYTPPAGTPVAISARLHTAPRRFGDLDREGYAQVIEDINQVVFLQSQVPAPVRNARVTFYSDATRTTAIGTYRIEHVIPATDDVAVTCEVKAV